MKTIQDFARKKASGEKFTMVTAYDYAMAQLVSRSQVDAVLVGDSVAMVMHGHPSTLGATVEMMALHTEAVTRGVRDRWVVADMPFLSFRKGIAPSLDAVGILMRAGANSVKIEGVRGHEEVIHHVVQSGVPVMGHLGLTPQSVHALGGYRVQGRENEAARQLLSDARKLQELGCYSIVLECVPSDLAGVVTKELSIPTIGIGAGPSTDGQVLVLQDLLGMGDPAQKPKFLRTFSELGGEIPMALDRFCSSVRDGSFPSEKESYL